MWRLDVALLRAAALREGVYRENAPVLLPVLLQIAASLPRTSRKKRALLPSRSGGAASAGGLAPAAHAPPPLSMRDPHAREGKGSPRTERRVPQRAGQRAAHLAVRLLQRPRTQEQRVPCLRRTCCLAWGLSSLSFASEGASNGQRVEEAWL